MSSAALDTLTQLEWRLSRVEFHLRGETQTTSSSSDKDNASEAVSSRLRRLEERLSDLREQAPAVDMLLKLREQHPQLFLPKTIPASGPAISDEDKLQIVLSSADTLSNTTSGLNSLKENPLPDAQPLASLIGLEPRIANAQGALERNAMEIEELRRRSARVLSKWYQGTVLEGGQNWADCEERLMAIEQTVLREEKTKQREADGV